MWCAQYELWVSKFYPSPFQSDNSVFDDINTCAYRPVKGASQVNTSPNKESLCPNENINTTCVFVLIHCDMDPWTHHAI